MTKTAETMNGMLLLRTALQTIATALERPNSTAGMVAELERALGAVFFPIRVSISIVGEAPAGAGKEIALRLDGDTIGVMFVQSPVRVRLEAEAEAVDILGLLAAPISAAIASRRRPERRGRDFQPANTDALCRIPNRRAFDEHMHEAWERALARGVPLVMALADVDFFKTYNDRYGHIAGDGCLQQVASLLVKRRDGDDSFAARYGGEEFVMVFEATTLERVVAAMQRIFDRLTALNIEHAGTTLGRISMSVGIAAVIPSHERSAVELVDEADRALYQAKRFGRNRICAGSFVSKGPVVSKLRARGSAYAAVDVPSFGRNDAVARMLSALRHSRMLTLVGRPGIGKSRLLSLIAHEASSRLHRSVMFVEPELLRADMDPASALASACDLTLDAGGVLDTVTDFLADREAIVILDDVEQSRAEIKTLCSHLIAHTSGLSIVAAAHAPLGIAGERTIVVPPLDDESALGLLTFCGGGEGAAGRAIIRHLGGNPASIQAAAEWIGRLGAGIVLDRLATSAGAGYDPAELAALFTAEPVGS